MVIQASLTRAIYNHVMSRGQASYAQQWWARGVGVAGTADVACRARLAGAARPADTAHAVRADAGAAHGHDRGPRQRPVPPCRCGPRM